jgi:hypothetical protein
MSQAQRLANYLARTGYYASVTRPPAEISNGDCVYAVKVPERQFAEILRLINQVGFERGKIYVYRPDGSTNEVNI